MRIKTIISSILLLGSMAIAGNAIAAAAAPVICQYIMIENTGWYTLQYQLVAFSTPEKAPSCASPLSGTMHGLANLITLQVPHADTWLLQLQPEASTSMATLFDIKNDGTVPLIKCTGLVDGYQCTRQK